MYQEAIDCDVLSEEDKKAAEPFLNAVERIQGWQEKLEGVAFLVLLLGSMGAAVVLRLATLASESVAVFWILATLVLLVAIYLGLRWYGYRRLRPELKEIVAEEEYRRGTGLFYRLRETDPGAITIMEESLGRKLL